MVSFAIECITFSKLWEAISSGNMTEASLGVDASLAHFHQSEFTNIVFWQTRYKIYRHPIVDQENGYVRLATVKDHIKTVGLRKS